MILKYFNALATILGIGLLVLSLALKPRHRLAAVIPVAELFAHKVSNVHTLATILIVK
jgi:hypothetical protein